MNNVYYRDIIDILTDCGPDGMSPARITRRLYNLHNDLFREALDYAAMRREVGFFLWSQSKKAHTPFVHVAFGRYALDRKHIRQLDLFFDFVVPEMEIPRIVIEPEPVQSRHVQLELF